MVESLITDNIESQISNVADEVDMCTQTENIVLTSIGTQTLKTYTKEATTSTKTLLKSSQHHVSTQTKFKESRKGKNVCLQYPTPQKKINCRSKLRAKYNSKNKHNNFSSESSTCTTDGENSEDYDSGSINDVLKYLVDSNRKESLGIDDFGCVDEKDGGVSGVVRLLDGDDCCVGEKGEGVVGLDEGDVCFTKEKDGGVVELVEGEICCVDEKDRGVVDVGEKDRGVVVNMECVNNEFVNIESKIVNSEIVYSELNPNNYSESSVFESSDDDDYIPSQVEESTEASENEVDLKEKIRNERTLLVYESKLYQLLQHCPKCGADVDQSLIEEVKNTGSQLHLKIKCFNNCDICRLEVSNYCRCTKGTWQFIFSNVYSIFWFTICKVREICLVS